MSVVHEFPDETRRAKRKAAVSFAIAVAAAIFPVSALHGWHTFVGLGLTLVGVLFGLARWRGKYPKTAERLRTVYFHHVFAYFANPAPVSLTRI